MTSVLIPPVGTEARQDPGDAPPSTALGASNSTLILGRTHFWRTTHSPRTPEAAPGAVGHFSRWQRKPTHPQEGGSGC